MCFILTSCYVRMNSSFVSGEIMRFLLSVIAVCLVMITAKLYIPEVQADVDGMNAYELASDWEFIEGVRMVVEDCQIKVNETIYVYDPEYVENIQLTFRERVRC